jgi:hypothetical protein
MLMLRCDHHVAGSKMQTALDQDLPPMGAGETVSPPMGFIFLTHRYLKQFAMKELRAIY